MRDAPPQLESFARAAEARRRAAHPSTGRKDPARCGGTLPGAPHVWLASASAEGLSPDASPSRMRDKAATAVAANGSRPPPSLRVHMPPPPAYIASDSSTASEEAAARRAALVAVSEQLTRALGFLGTASTSQPVATVPVVPDPILCASGPSDPNAAAHRPHDASDLAESSAGSCAESLIDSYIDSGSEAGSCTPREHCSGSPSARQEHNGIAEGEEDSISELDHERLAVYESRLDLLARLQCQPAAANTAAHKPAGTNAQGGGAGDRIGNIAPAPARGSSTVAERDARRHAQLRAAALAAVAPTAWTAEAPSPQSGVQTGALATTLDSWGEDGALESDVMEEQTWSREVPIVVHPRSRGANGMTGLTARTTACYKSETRRPAALFDVAAPGEEGAKASRMGTSPAPAPARAASPLQWGVRQATPLATRNAAPLVATATPQQTRAAAAASPPGPRRHSLSVEADISSSSSSTAASTSTTATSSASPPRRSLSMRMQWPWARRSRSRLGTGQTDTAAEQREMTPVAQGKHSMRDYNSSTTDPTVTQLVCQLVKNPQRNRPQQTSWRKRLRFSWRKRGDLNATDHDDSDGEEDDEDVSISYSVSMEAGDSPAQVSLEGNFVLRLEASALHLLSAGRYRKLLTVSYREILRYGENKGCVWVEVGSIHPSAAGMFRFSSPRSGYLFASLHQLASHER